MRFISYACVAGLCLAIGGCGSKGSSYKPTPAKGPEKASASSLTPETAFPLAVGNQWVYLAEMAAAPTGKQGGRIAQDIVWKVSKVENLPDGKRGTIDVLVKDKVTDRQVWLVTSKGVFQESMSMGKMKFNPPLPAMLFPMEDGRQFSWKGPSPRPFGNTITATSKSKVLAATIVDTQKEPLSAIPIETNTSFGSSQKGIAVSTAYFAPKVGMVRYNHAFRSPEGQSVTRLTLKSFRAAQ